MMRKLLLACCLCLFASIANADYKDDYKAGIQAADLKQWSEVVRRMELSIAAKPKEGEQVAIYGMRFEPYLPHYHLGVAQFNLGNCEAALRAWAESERQRAVTRTSFYANLKRLRASCPETQPIPPKIDAAPAPVPTPSGPDPALTRAIASAELEVERAEAAADTLARLHRGTDAAEVWNADGDFKSRESQTAQKLTSAKTKLAQAKAEGKLSEVQSAGQAALAARAEFEAIRKDFLAQQREFTEWREASALMKKRAGEAEALLRTPVPASPNLTAAAAELRTLIGSTRQVSRKTPAGQVQAVTARLAASITDYQKLLSSAPQPADAPPAALVSAAAAYFRGDYAQSIALLESVRFDSRLASAQAMLFRGASRYALYLMGGEKDQQLRARALQDLREAGRLDKRAVPDPRFFSPRLGQFAQSTAPSR